MTARLTAFDAIGTRWNVQVIDTLTNKAWSELLERIHGRIQQFDKAYSRFRADSLITQFSLEAGTHDLPTDAYALFKFYKQLYDATRGKVTPLIGQVMVDAGYDANYSLRTKELHKPPKWEDTLSFTRTSITLKKPALLDFGAAGKGYLIDIIGKLLSDFGLRAYMINAGGDILHRSHSNGPLSVGLENPVDTTEAIGVATLLNRSLCASSGSKRKWGNFHHIIDPAALESPMDILATWVIADETMVADGLATGLFFADPVELQKKFDFSYAILQKDMTLYRSKDFPVTVFEAVDE